jgi:antitoxin ChpS
MTTATLRAVGGSIMVAIPKPILDGLGLTANEKVSLRLDGKSLIVEPKKKTKLHLAELLAQCDLKAPPHPDLKLWDELEPIGKEII